MAIEAPASKFRKNNIKIYIVACFIAAAWFFYDGYFNKNFIEKQTDENGKPNSTLVFNQKSPPFFAAGAVLLGVYLVIINKKKLLADENELIINNKITIPYDSIEKINKTYFESKGYFILTFKDNNRKEADIKISNRKYDGLENILNHLIKKIS